MKLGQVKLGEGGGVEGPTGKGMVDKKNSTEKKKGRGGD